MSSLEPKSIADFKQHGYLVLTDLLDHNELELLRKECEQVYEAHVERALRAAEDCDPLNASRAILASGCILEPIPGCKEASQAAYLQQRSQLPCIPEVSRILFGSKMQALAMDLLGTTGYLFNDQYIVKPPRCPESAFRLHHDSAWCSKDAAVYHSYISIWCPLGDVSAENGTLIVEALGCQPADSVQLNIKAGSACVLSDTVRHSSLPNKSLRSRQVWMPQFSAAPLLWRDNGLPVSMAVPCHAVLLGNVTNAVL